MEWQEPIYQYGDDASSVAIYVDGEDLVLYECADADVAHEICSAMNLVWQSLIYGAADPVARDRFNREYGHLHYGPEDVQEFASRLDRAGVLPPNWQVSRKKH